MDHEKRSRYLDVLFHDIEKMKSTIADAQNDISQADVEWTRAKDAARKCAVQLDERKNTVDEDYRPIRVVDEREAKTTCLFCSRGHPSDSCRSEAMWNRRCRIIENTQRCMACGEKKFVNRKPHTCNPVPCEYCLAFERNTGAQAPAEKQHISALCQLARTVYPEHPHKEPATVESVFKTHYK